MRQSLTGPAVSMALPERITALIRQLIAREQRGTPSQPGQGW
jgi:hypothetical protein